MEHYLAGAVKDIFDARGGKPAEQAVTLMLSAFAQNVREDTVIAMAQQIGVHIVPLPAGVR